jgi:hypothetical protein
VTYALTVPKGSEPWLDDADVRSVEATAKANGWTNEEAQAQLDAHADVLAQQSTAFRTETEAHPVYGGEHLGETQRLANLVLDRFAASGDPIAEQLRRDLVKSGYGNKPFWRASAKRWPRIARRLVRAPSSEASRKTPRRSCTTGSPKRSSGRSPQWQL